MINYEVIQGIPAFILSRFPSFLNEVSTTYYHREHPIIQKLVEMDFLVYKDNKCWLNDKGEALREGLIRLKKGENMKMVNYEEIKVFLDKLVTSSGLPINVICRYIKEYAEKRSTEEWNKLRCRFNDICFSNNYNDQNCIILLVDNLMKEFSEDLLGVKNE